MFFKWMRARKRMLDIQILWQACKEGTTDIDLARQAFYAHASNDDAWTKDYTEEQLLEYVSGLK